MNNFDNWLIQSEMQIETAQRINQFEQTRLLQEQNRLLQKQQAADAARASREQAASAICPFCASSVNKGAALCPHCKIPFFGLDLTLLNLAVKKDPTLVLPENLTVEKLTSACEAERAAEIQEGFNRCIELARGGSNEHLATATWWALEHGKEADGLAWFNEGWDKIPTRTLAKDRLANTYSNGLFLMLALGKDTGPILDGFYSVAEASTEAKFAPALISSRLGDDQTAQEIMGTLSPGQITSLRNIYTEVTQDAQTNDLTNTWFCKWAQDALALLEKWVTANNGKW